MKRTLIIGILSMLAAAVPLLAQAGGAANNSAPRVLYVYEESNKYLDSYRVYFRDALAKAGLQGSEVAAGAVKSADLAQSDCVIIHGAVMASALKSPVRDWLKSGPALRDKKVSVFITASNGPLEKFSKQIADLLAKLGVTPVDAVSTATKKLDEKGKRALVEAAVEKLK